MTLFWNGSAMGRIEEIYRRTWRLGLSMFNRNQERAYWTLWTKVMNTYSFCQATAPGKELSQGKYVSAFRHGEQALPIEEYLRRRNESATQNQFSVVVRRVDQGDREALKAELLDIADLAKLAFPNSRDRNKRN